MLRIKTLRLSRGLQQPLVAEALGVSQATMSRWESDGSQVSLRQLQRLSEYYATPMAALLVDAATVPRL